MMWSLIYALRERNQLYREGGDEDGEGKSQEGKGKAERKWAHSCNDRQRAVIGESVDRRSTNRWDEEGILVW